MSTVKQIVRPVQFAANPTNENVVRSATPTAPTTAAKPNLLFWGVGLLAIFYLLKK